MRIEQGDEDKKPNVQSDAITLLAKSQHGVEVMFRIGRSAPLKKIMHRFCDITSVDFRSVFFLFNYQILREHQTPEELLMKDGDEILAVSDCIGG